MASNEEQERLWEEQNRRLDGTQLLSNYLTLLEEEAAAPWWKRLWRWFR